MDAIKSQIIIKLGRRDIWGHKLINFSDLIKVVPKHLRGDAKQAIEELHKEGFLNKKPGNRSEFRYSLCLDKKPEIDDIISRRTNVQ